MAWPLSGAAMTSRHAQVQLINAPSGAECLYRLMQKLPANHATKFIRRKFSSRRLRPPAGSRSGRTSTDWGEIEGTCVDSNPDPIHPADAIALHASLQEINCEISMESRLPFRIWSMIKNTATIQGFQTGFGNER